MFRTTDLGLTWEPIAGNLPEAPVNDLLADPFDPDRYFVATDVGVFETLDGGASWSVLGTGLPNVVATSLALEPLNQVLVVGTFGRSLFSLPGQARPALLRRVRVWRPLPLVGRGGGLVADAGELAPGSPVTWQSRPRGPPLRSPQVRTGHGWAVDHADESPLSKPSPKMSPCGTGAAPRTTMSSTCQPSAVMRDVGLQAEADPALGHAVESRRGRGGPPATSSAVPS